MIGYSTRIAPYEGETETPNVISVVVSKDFPDREMIAETLTQGAALEGPDTVWVLRGTPIKGDALQVADDTLRAAGIEPIYAETNRTHWGNRAGAWRDNEMMLYSRMTVIFHDQKSGVTKVFADVARDPYRNKDGKLKLIERGQKKKVQRKGRKPIGA